MPPFAVGHTPRSKGKIIGQKRPLKPEAVQLIRAALEAEGSRRDCLLFDLALDSKLRACDLVRLKIGDVVAHGCPRDRTTVMQKKTKRPVQFEITPRTRAKLQAWLQPPGWDEEDYLFPSELRDSHISEGQYARFIRKCILLAGLDPSTHAVHSMRRTKVTQLYRKTGNLRAVQLLLGHANITSTVVYLGVEVEDALLLSEQVDI